MKDYKKFIAAIIISTQILSITYSYADSSDGYETITEVVDKVVRIEGSDRYETSIKISEKFLDTGSTLVLTSGKNYADALSASTLTNGEYPLLLTDSDSISDITMGEINRLSPRKIIIVGGESSISKNVENTLSDKGIEVVRIAGDDRYQTSIDVGEYGQNKNTLVVSGENFPDAISAGALTKVLDSSVILTPKSKASDRLKSYLTNQESALIVGGENTISKNVETDISGILSTQRVGGADRFETSVLLSDKLGIKKSVIITTGENFPDALSASSFAQKEGAPILLSSKDTLPVSVGRFLEKNYRDIENVYIIGGKNSISDEVVKEVRDILTSGSYSPPQRPETDKNTIDSNDTTTPSDNEVKNPETISNPNLNIKNGVYKIDTDYISQLYPTYAPVGCEGAASLMALKSRGYAKGVTLKSYLDKMPKTSRDPEFGFVGSPYVAEKRYTTINPRPLKEYANTYGKAVNATGYSTDQVVDEIKSGNPVVIWTTIDWKNPKTFTYKSQGKNMVGYSNNHSVAAIGYDSNKDMLLFADPLNTANKYKDFFYWKARSLVKNIYELRKYAVVIK